MKCGFIFLCSGKVFYWIFSGVNNVIEVSMRVFYVENLVS